MSINLKLINKKQETLLAYEWHPKTENLISLGVHEIFFKNLKN